MLCYPISQFESLLTGIPKTSEITILVLWGLNVCSLLSPTWGDLPARVIPMAVVDLLNDGVQRMCNVWCAKNHIIDCSGAGHIHNHSPYATCPLPSQQGRWKLLCHSFKQGPLADRVWGFSYKVFLRSSFIPKETEVYPLSISLKVKLAIGHVVLGKVTSKFEPKDTGIWRSHNRKSEIDVL